MVEQARKAEQFRALAYPGQPLVLFNIWDAVAPGRRASGVKAVATGGWSVANAHGFADGERMPRVLAIDNLGRIVAATDLPVTIDLESGYGDTSKEVGEAIGLAIGARAVGCNHGGQLSGRMERPRGPSNKVIASDTLAGRPTQPVSASSSTRGQTSFSNDRPNSMTRRWSSRRSRASYRAYAGDGAVTSFAPGLADIALIARPLKRRQSAQHRVGDATPRCAPSHSMASQE